LFAPALTVFGVEPHKVIFISLHKDKDALWVMEEALKCTGLTAMVCEMGELDFKQSRRLQLAVEQSRVTGFVLRNASGRLNATACAARWQVKPFSSAELNGLTGLGFFALVGGSAAVVHRRKELRYSKTYILLGVHSRLSEFVYSLIIIYHSPKFKS
jgi:hypothetical protein